MSERHWYVNQVMTNEILCGVSVKHVCATTVYDTHPRAQQASVATGVRERMCHLSRASNISPFE